MSQVVVKQIAGRVKELFEQYIDTSDLNKTKDPDYENKLITRCLAAYYSRRK